MTVLSTDVELDSLQQAVRDDRMQLISDIVSISQTPAPTGDESDRAQLMIDEFRELGVDDVTSDDAGNVVAKVKQTEAPTVCLVAHLDTVFDRSQDHTAFVDDETIQGPGVGDDSLGLATLLSILRLLDRDQLKNVLLVATTGTEGEGNLSGSRHFLERLRSDIEFAICLEGHRLGRLEHRSMGTDRLRIHVGGEGGHVWRDQTSHNPIVIISELVDRLQSIGTALDKEDSQTVLNLAQVEGGTAYNTVPYESWLKVEIRAREETELARISDMVEEQVKAVDEQADEQISIEEISRRPASGISKNHWLVRSVEAVQAKLALQTKLGPASSDSSVFLDNGIPTLTLGLARGANKHLPDERIQVDSLEQGQLQTVLSFLEARRASVTQA